MILRIAFLGFNPIGNGYDGRGKINLGADRTFPSLDSLGALRFIRKSARNLTQAGGRHHPTETIDLRLTGYSFGGWTALQLAHELPAIFGERISVRIGLVDPIPTFRQRRRWHTPVFTWPPVSWLSFASRPIACTVAMNVYQTRGLIARFNCNGFRKPLPSAWFRSLPIEGFENRDVSAEVSDGAGHLDVCEKYGAEIAARIFET